MTNQRGFTLIELVVVIVILGILAVTAAPRFLNLQSDARVSALQGMKGAMAGAGSIVYGKAAINGVETSSQAVDVSNIETIFGYPSATSAGIVAAVQGLEDDAEWKYEENTGSLKATFAASDDSAFTDNSGCFVKYEQVSESGNTPQITVEKTGC